jgi:preprotein translocase SecE subunit
MIKYFKNSIKEIQKVTWPKKEHALNLTVITIIFTIVITLGLTLVDKVLNAGYQTLLDLSPSTITTDAPQIDINDLDIDFEPTTIGEEETPVEPEVSSEEVSEADSE